MIETRSEPWDEFYIGYEERMPSGIARRVVRAVMVFAVVAAGGTAVALLAQQSLPASRFEFGVVQPVAGVLRRDPYPWLDVNGRRVWLVGPGKFGAAQVLGDTFDGPVVVEGTAIRRGQTRMLEVTGFRARSESTPNRFRVRSECAPNGFGIRSECTPNEGQPRVTLTGEVVDSKCFLGVMNPGEGAVHRDCARRCLSGGIPPMLIVRNAVGVEELVLLVSEDGRPIGRELARRAGTPITVTGRLARDGDQYVLYADSSAFRRVRPN